MIEVVTKKNIFRWVTSVLVMLLFGNYIGAEEKIFVLAKNGAAKAQIVIADSAAIYEKTAAEELAEYLFKVTGGRFEIENESRVETEEKKIFIGSTAFANKQGINTKNLGEEEWVIKTIGNNLVLGGGHTRGTLYAVFHFLEDVVGVRWWNSFEEFVPQKDNLACGQLNLRKKPVFDYRDIFSLYAYDDGLFATRNRLNTRFPVSG